MKKEGKELRAILSALSDLYISLQVIDLTTLASETVKTDFPLQKMGAGAAFQEQFYEIIRQVVAPD